MVEPIVRQKTGLSVREHQRRTLASYLELCALAPDLPWIPVLQGWEYADYLEHLEMYTAAGVGLASLPVVGLGSVCRRQDTSLAEELIRELCSLGLKVHGFGFKLQGLWRLRSLANLCGLPGLVLRRTQEPTFARVQPPALQQLHDLRLALA